MNSIRSLLAQGGPAVSFTVMPGTLGDAPSSLSQTSRERLTALLSSAMRDPSMAQQIRVGLANSASSSSQILLLDDQEVVRQMTDAVLNGQVVLAETGGGEPAPKGWKPYEHGDKLSPAVRFEKGSGAWVGLWKVSPDGREGDLAFAPSQFEFKPDGAVLTPVTPGAAITAELLATLNGMMDKAKAAEKEQVDTAKTIKEDEKNLAAAENEQAALEATLEEATTEEEKKNIQSKLVNAEAKIEHHTNLIKVRKEYIEDQKTKVKELTEAAKRGAENVRLHEQVHLDVTAYAAQQANPLLKRETDPTRRRQIVHGAIAICDETSQLQDDVLNPITFGSAKDDAALAAWISESSSQNYRATIREKFAKPFKTD